MASSSKAPRLSEAQEKSLRNIPPYEFTLWARMDNYFQNVEIIPPQLLPQNAYMDWKWPSSSIIMLLSRLICVPLFRIHPQLIPVGLEIVRYHRLINSLTMETATASTHPSIVTACQSVDEDTTRNHLADATRFASPLGEIFPGPPSNDFLFKCKLLATQRGSKLGGKHYVKATAIITADLELLVEAWDSHAVETDGKSALAYATGIRVANDNKKILESKRKWMLRQLRDFPQDPTFFDDAAEGGSDYEETYRSKLVPRGNKAPKKESRAPTPTAEVTRKRRREASDSPIRNTRRRISSRHPHSVLVVPSPVKDVLQMSHSQLQNCEKEICSQLPLLQKEIDGMRETLNEKVRQKSELMSRLSQVNQRLASFSPDENRTAQDDQSSTGTSSAALSKESSSPLNNPSDFGNPGGKVFPQQLENLEHGSDSISQNDQLSKSLTPPSLQQQPKKNSSLSLLSSSKVPLESIEEPIGNNEPSSLEVSSEISPERTPCGDAADEEAEIPNSLLKFEQSPTPESLQPIPEASQSKPDSNHEDFKQPVHKAPTPAFDQSNMTAATPRQRFDLTNYRLEIWIAANPECSQEEINGYFGTSLDGILQQLQEESGKSVEEFTEARSLARNEVLDVAQAFYDAN